MGHPRNDDKRFPDRLRLANGTLLQRDPTRLVLFLKQAHELRYVERILANLPTYRGSRLELEDQENWHRGRTSEPITKQINHTDKRFWVKTPDQQMINPYIALLESGFASNIERVAGVYSIPGIDGRQALYCPMPHSLIVVKRATADDSSLDEVLAQFNFEIIRDLSKLLGRHTRYCVLKGAPPETVFEAHARLHKDKTYQKLVETVVLDFMPLLSPNAVIPNDEYYRADNPPGRLGQWNMKLIGAENAWGLSKGSNVTVAVIDPEGVDASHGDLPWSTLQNANRSVGVTFDTPPPLPTPGMPPVTGYYSGQNSPATSHGTRCAGIIAARMNNGRNSNTGVAGLACECSLLPIRAQTRQYSEWGAGIAYAAITGNAQVISMSFGEPYEGLQKLNVAEILDAIIEDAFTRGVVLVAASGNGNSSTIIDYPASHPRVIACGASNGGYADPSKQDYRCQPVPLGASSVNHPLGDLAWGNMNVTTGTKYGSNYGPELSVMAPGMNLILNACVGKGNLAPPNTYSDYDENVVGTSLATPHVAGIAALLFQKYPALANPPNPQRVRDIIERTAEKVHNHDTPGYVFADNSSYPNGPWCSEMGYGRVNAYRALDYAELLIKDHPTDTGSEPSLSLPTGSTYWNSSNIVIRPVGDTKWDPSDVMNASYVAQGDNICYVEVQNNGPADARNVQVRATIWPRQRAAEIRLRDVRPFGRRIALHPVNNQAADITTQIIYTPEVPNVWLVIASIPAGTTRRVQFKLNGYYPLSWARGDADAYFDKAMGQIGPRHILLVAEATADNDYAYQSAIKSNVADIVTKRRNVAMRELRFHELDPYP